MSFSELRKEAELSLKQDSIPKGNDVAIFGKKIQDARLQVALSLGWFIEKHEYQGKFYYDLRPPSHFECSKNSWCATMETLSVDDIKLSVPHWYYNDNVLVKGTW